MLQETESVKFTLKGIHLGIEKLNLTRVRTCLVIYEVGADVFFHLPRVEEQSGNVPKIIT